MVNILVQMLVLNLKPESKTLGSVFPVKLQDTVSNLSKQNCDVDV